MTGQSRVVTVICTSTANLASVVTGFERMGCNTRMTTSPDEVLTASHLVLPGVGAFAAASATLSGHGLLESLRARIERGRPTLAICLGMQLLAQGSEEARGTPGLSVMEGVATRYTSGVVGCPIPQMGWNLVSPAEGCRIVPRGYAYFANSYRLTVEPRGWQPVWCEYAGRFLAAVERGAVVGCQFHPELSGEYGKSLMSRWLEN